MEPSLVEAVVEPCRVRPEDAALPAAAKAACKDSRYRSITKAATYRVIGSLATVAVTWAVTGQPKVAAAVGLGDTILKVVLFYFHERAWDRIRFGRKQQPEYEI